MKKATLILFASLPLFFCLSLSSQALTLIDNFDSLTNGSIVGQNGWTEGALSTGTNPTFDVITDPNNSSNKVLNITSHGNASINKSLGGLSVTNDTTGTLYFEIMTASESTTSSRLWSGYANNAVTNFANGRAYSFVRENDIVYARNGGSDTAISDAGEFERDTWYGIWLVATNNASTTDTYDVYIQGGEWETQTLLADNFSMRGGTSGDLSFVSFFGSSGSTGPWYVDNIYGTMGTDLGLPPTSNIPEPTSGLLLLLAGVAFGLRRRRR